MEKEFLQVKLYSTQSALNTALLSIPIDQVVDIKPVVDYGTKYLLIYKVKKEV